MQTIKYDTFFRRSATFLAVAILTFALLAAGTGILLAYYYEPTAGGAYESISRINDTVSYGWFVRSVHNVAGNGIIVAALVQVVVMFLGRQLRPSWFVGWVSGVLLALNAIGLGWTAMILNWSQEGFWRLKIELATLQSIPLVGQTIRDILTGGGGINSDTVMHFYTLHSYVLSLGAVLLSVVHLGSLIIQKRDRRRQLIEQLERLVPTAETSDSEAERVAQ